MIRITIELDEELAERRKDDSLRERLRRGVERGERDRRILRRLRDNDEPERIYCGGGTLKWPDGASFR